MSDHVTDAVRQRIAALQEILATLDSKLAGGPLPPYTLARLAIEVDKAANTLEGIPL